MNGDARYLGRGDYADGGLRGCGQIADSADGFHALEFILFLIECGEIHWLRLCGEQRTGWTGVTSLLLAWYHFNTYTNQMWSASIADWTCVEPQ